MIRAPLALHTVQMLASGHPSFFESCVDVGVQAQTRFLVSALPDARHILVEPAKEYHRQIEKNYEGIRYTLLPVAASGQSGTKQLLSMSNKRNGALSHTSIVSELSESDFRKLKDADPDFYLGYTEISALTLDELCGGESLAPHTYAIKIDIDGLEAEVIAASKDAVQNASVMIVESTTGVRYQSDRDIGKLIPMVENKGMTLIDIVSPCYYNQKLSQVDLVFLNTALFKQYAEGGNFDINLWQNDSKLIEALQG